jgi:hypothetical protein
MSRPLRVRVPSLRPIPLFWPCGALHWQEWMTIRPVQQNRTTDSHKSVKQRYILGPGGHLYATGELISDEDARIADRVFLPVVERLINALLVSLVTGLPVTCPTAETVARHIKLN